MGKSVLLLQTLELLRTKPGITISDLAEELGRSERTVYRYLSDLCTTLNIPIYCHEGAYRLAARNGSSAISNLTADEALAVHVALKSTAISSPGPFSFAAKSALRKIESALKDPAFNELQEMRQRHLLAPSVFGNGKVDPDLAKSVGEAVKRNQRLKITYRSQRSATVEELLIDPYGVAFRRHNWYIVAYSHKHSKVIQLKLTRVQSVTVTGDTFEPVPDFSIERFYENSWEVWTGEEEVTVKVRFSAHIAPIIRESSFHHTQTIEDTADGGLIMTTCVAGTQEIGAWILGYGADAEVLEPKDLRDWMKNTAREMTEMYSNI